MVLSEPHRKRVKHFNVFGHVHELTFSCYHRLPLLDNDSRRILLSRAIDAAMARCRFHLVGFVFMPEHVHLLVRPLEPTSEVSRLLYAIKRPLAYRVKQMMESSRDPRLAGLIVRERPGKQAFRFWQEGPGYDRNLAALESVVGALNYAHANPVRRGLCASPDCWKWSSWRHYQGGVQADADLPVVHGLPSE